MRNLSSLRKFISLVMAVVILISAVSGVALKEQLLEPLQDTVSHKVFIMSADENTDQGLDDDHKPRIYSLDHFATWGDSSKLPPYSPLIATLFFREPYRALTETYREIFIPPENLG